MFERTKEQLITDILSLEEKIAELRELEKLQAEAGDDAEVDLGDLDRPETVEAWEEKQAELVVETDKTYNYWTLPRANLEQIILRHKETLTHLRTLFENRGEYAMSAARKGLAEYRKSETATISFMVKEFEMKKRADEYARTMSNKTGRLDLNKLHAYRTSEDIFLSQQVIKSGKNHGFVMFIDWSGSMNGVKADVMKQAITMALFCRKVNIPFEVYMFTTAHHRLARDSEQWDYTVYADEKDGFAMGSVQITELLNSGMNTSTFNEALLGMWMLGNSYTNGVFSMGGTPLLETIHAARFITKDFVKRHRVQIPTVIFLTDGDGCSIYPRDGYYGRNKCVDYLVDEETRQNFRWTTEGRYGNSTITYDAQEKIFIDLLRETTGANVIGYYVEGTANTSALKRKWFSGYKYRRSDWEYSNGWTETAVADQIKHWNSNGFITAKKTGYDTFYVLNPLNLRIQKTELAVTSDMTKAKLRKAFTNFQRGKAVNRVMLKQFIEEIAA